MKDSFVLRGNIIYSVDKDNLSVTEGGYAVCEDGICRGVYRELPDEFKEFDLIDCGDKLVIPGMYDLHAHAPQYAFRGLGMDLELLDWLNSQAFPEESKYRDEEYARRAYRIFVEDLKNSFTCRASIFATAHTEATKILMSYLEESGLKTYVGRVNMDRNAADYLVEESAEFSLRETVKTIEETAELENTKFILTPRFIPSCTDELMKGISDIRKQYGLNVQSHLSENFGEIDWVRELCPWSDFYGDAYDRFGLFGGEDYKAIMAHCVHCSDEEIALMKERGVYVAHCPQSNTDLSSGIAPIRKYLNSGLKVGLGSDIAAGYTLDMFRTIVETVQVSKLYWRLVDESMRPVTVKEAFYLATVGGGSFYGKLGRFEEGYEFDALVLDDSSIRTSLELNPGERLERAIYLGNTSLIIMKFVSGREISLEKSAQ